MLYQEHLAFLDIINLTPNLNQKVVGNQYLLKHDIMKPITELMNCMATSISMIECFSSNCEMND